MRDKFGSMNKTKFGVLRGLAALSLCMVFGLARAQDSDAYDTDPPDRAARLSYLQGDVSLQPAGEEEWAAAIVNRPLTTGDKLWTDQGARAEVDVGRAAVRLDSNTGFSFLNVDDDTIQMRITAGVINVTVRALDGNEQIEVDTPNLALSLQRPGSYRVEVNDDGDTTVVRVSEGVAEANAGSQHVIVHAQQVVTFSGVEQLASQFGTLGAPDDFDSWSLERERHDERAETSQTAQYVSPDVTGYEDLNDNGTWSSESEYGYVWTPTHVAVGWSPYQYGRWTWVGPWGWTWIDDAPWGYAPFHYGRWAHVRSRWCWVPGPRHVRAVYAPALVGWAGPPGGVAWFPLAPREVYVPARHFSHRYVERVNASNTVNVSRALIANVYENRARDVVYRNRAVPGAVTAVSHATFTSAERVGGRRIRVDERELARTPVTAMAPRIAPVRESRLGDVESRRNVRVPPLSVVSRETWANRPQEHRGQPDTRNQSPRPDTVRHVPRMTESHTLDTRDAPNVQNWRDNRAQEVRQHTDRPPPDYRPQPYYRPRVEVAAPQPQPQPQPSQSVQRPSVDQHPEIRQRVREHLERPQQAPQPQATRQVEPPQYQPREQHQQREPQHQQHEQRQVEQPQRPAEAKPQPERARNNGRADRYDSDRR
jgi:hypothetical protein